MRNPCGSSEATLQKEALISVCLGHALSLLRPRKRRDRYCVFDLNAGRPFNRVGEKQCRGTTRIVMDKLQKQDIRSAIWWCDENRDVVTHLQHEAPTQGHLFDDDQPIILQVVHADNI